MITTSDLLNSVIEVKGMVKKIYEVIVTKENKVKNINSKLDLIPPLNGQLTTLYWVLNYSPTPEKIKEQILLVEKAIDKIQRETDKQREKL